MSHCYTFIVNIILYESICLIFMVLEDIFCLNIILYKNFARIYLSITKFIL